MPPVSKRQKRFFQAIEHSPEFAKKVGVKQSIAREFLHPKKKVKKRKKS